MAGEWSSDDLAGVLTEFAKSMADLIPRVAAATPADRRCPSTAFAVQQPRTGPAQHLRALRPVQRAVRGVPRRDDDLLQRPVRHVACHPARSWPTRSSARSTACSTRRGSGRAAGCWRSEPAGANCASAPPRAVRTVRSVTLSAEQQQLAPAAGRRRGPVGPGATSSCSTTATSTAATTPWCRSR